jgi:hypothetical protein
LPLLPPILFPGLSRCGVSDGVAPQRAVARIGQPIRGPDAGQSRQPQRVQPGGFFRPLFGRSKRGHPDRFYQQDDHTEEGTQSVRSPNHIEREGYLPAQQSPTECRRTTPCGGPAVGGGQCDWPHRRQGGSPVNPRLGLGYGGMGRGRGRSFGLKDPPMLADWIGSGRRTYRGRSESLSRLPARVAHRLWTEAIGLEPERASACT